MVALCMMTLLIVGTLIISWSGCFTVLFRCIRTAAGVGSRLILCRQLFSVVVVVLAVGLLIILLIGNGPCERNRLVCLCYISRSAASDLCRTSVPSVLKLQCSVVSCLVSVVVSIRRYVLVQVCIGGTELLSLLVP